MHFFENFLSDNPFPIVQDVGRMVEGWRTCRRLAGDIEQNIVPGHDPILKKMYPAVAGTNGEAIRLDVPPSMWPPKK
jgi:glyoxylase-like metal-dependent hydrolase (beta-lactamase superfamily II)